MQRHSHYMPLACKSWLHTSPGLKGEIKKLKSSSKLKIIDKNNPSAEGFIFCKRKKLGTYPIISLKKVSK